MNKYSPAFVVGGQETIQKLPSCLAQKTFCEINRLSFCENPLRNSYKIKKYSKLLHGDLIDTPSGTIDNCFSMQSMQTRCFIGLHMDAGIVFFI